MTKIVMQVLGYAFLVLGILGLVLPILQGILFLIIGLILLSRSAGWAEAMLARIKSKHPKLAQTIGRAEDFAERLEERFLRLIGKN